MRFKAKLAPEQISLLCSLIGPISRIAGEGSSGGYGGSGGGAFGAGSGTGSSILYLDSDFLRLSTKGKSASDTDGISCFAELKSSDGIFLEHRIESVVENNVIVMELDLAQLRVALQSISAANEKDGSITMMDNSVASNGTQRRKRSRGSSTTATSAASCMSYRITMLKLAKRNGMPCLCLDAHAAPGAGMEVSHAVPVRICRATEAQHHLPPQINMPDVQLELPLDRPLRTIVERLRSISPQVYLEGSAKGELTIRVDTDGSSIRTFFNNLIPRFDDDEEEADGNGNDVENNNNNRNRHNRSCVVKVDTKKLCAGLQWQQPSLLHGHAITTALVCFVENEMLVVHVLLNPASVGFFTYYVPVHYLDDDENE